MPSDIKISMASSEVADLFTLETEQGQMFCFAFNIKASFRLLSSSEIEPV